MHPMMCVLSGFACDSRPQCSRPHVGYVYTHITGHDAKLLVISDPGDLCTLVLASRFILLLSYLRSLLQHLFYNHLICISLQLQITSMNSPVTQQ